jgi:hypothetical protein
MHKYGRNPQKLYAWRCATDEREGIQTSKMNSAYYGYDTLPPAAQRLKRAGVYLHDAKSAEPGGAASMEKRGILVPAADTSTCWKLAFSFVWKE